MYGNCQSLKKTISFKHQIIWRLTVGESFHSALEESLVEENLWDLGTTSSDQPINQSNLSLQKCQEKHATALASRAIDSTSSHLLCDHHLPLQLRVKK